jgi:hypothetical protein
MRKKGMWGGQKTQKTHNGKREKKRRKHSLSPFLYGVLAGKKA